MTFFSNKRKDFSIQLPKQSVANGAFTVTDSANIDFTYALNNLTANLTTTGILAGTYGSSTLIPILTLDSYGRVTGVSTTTFSASGIALEVNGTPNFSQVLLNLKSGTDISVVDNLDGSVSFNYTGTGGGSWGSIGAGTGVGSQTDLVTYLNANYYPLSSNPAGYLTTISGLNISLLTNDSGYITSAALLGYVPYTGATADVDLGLFDITAAHLIKDGGVSTQFLKADGSIDNNVYLTSADLPSTLDLFATTFPDPIIPTYNVLVRNILDPRFNTTAVDVSTGTITTTDQLISSLISDTNVISGNPGLFNITTIGNVRKLSGSGEANFFFRIYRRDAGGVETFITLSSNTLPVTTGVYVEFSATALWNNGIFNSTDRIVIKYYANRIPGGSNPVYQFQFGGISPVRTVAAVPVAVLPNIYLSNLVDVEDVPPLPNEVLYWNNTANLWEHSLVNDLVVATKSVQNISSNLELVGDLLAPGNNKVYGTDGAGVKGWKADPTGGGNSIGELTADVTAGPAGSPSASVAATLATSYKSGSASVIFDGAGGVITANTVAYVQVPYNGLITAWTIVSTPTATGTCTITAFKLSSYPPTTPTNNIFNTQPALTGTAFNQDLTPDFVLGQDVVTAGDWIGFRITVPVTVTWVNLTIAITKTV